MDTSFHIAFGVDSHYFRGMGVAIASVLAHNPGIDVVFHVFAFTVSPENRTRLREIEVRHKCAVEIHIVDPAVFGEYARFPAFSQYSAAIFTRLLIPAALRGVTDKVLYLDSDILCIGSMNELIAMELRHDIVALVHDNGPETVSTQCERLGLRAMRYFNSGLLYIHIENWIANDITGKTMRAVLDSGRKFMFPDQDALNIVLDGKATFIDEKWNFQYNLDNQLKAGKLRMCDIGQPVFIHFTGRAKPWHDWSMHEARALFLKYQSLSPWADMPLDPPSNYKEMRMLSRYLLKQGRSARAARWFVKYLLAKYSTQPTHKAM